LGSGEDRVKKDTQRWFAGGGGGGADKQTKSCIFIKKRIRLQEKEGRTKSIFTKRGGKWGTWGEQK